MLDHHDAPASGARSSARGCCPSCSGIGAASDRRGPPPASAWTPCTSLERCPPNWISPSFPHRRNCGATGGVVGVGVLRVALRPSCGSLSRQARLRDVWPSRKRLRSGGDPQEGHSERDGTPSPGARFLSFCCISILPALNGLRGGPTAARKAALGRRLPPAPVRATAAIARLTSEERTAQGGCDRCCSSLARPSSPAAARTSAPRTLPHCATSLPVVTGMRPRLSDVTEQSLHRVDEVGADAFAHAAPCAATASSSARLRPRAFSWSPASAASAGASGRRHRSAAEPRPVPRREGCVPARQRVPPRRTRAGRTP